MKEKSPIKAIKDIILNYKECKRFIAYTEHGINILHDSTNLSNEIGVRKKYVFNFECSLALLDDKLRDIFQKDLDSEDTYWYIGTMSRSTYYRHREKACEQFMKNFKRLENL
ncbi:MAG: hypothetical protein SO253_00560 [Bacilli bacterium]|nr:hypothetical protein [Bacilli bacterium]